jgi:acyl-CoA thioesterase-1
MFLRKLPRDLRALAFGLLAVWAFGRLGAVPLKVACVGDSITEGSGLSNPSTESYPAKLQRLLGANYQVRNFGVSGRTLLKKGDFPYWNEGAYTQSRNFAPDVVIIKLGTNDSKPQNWRYSTNFVGDYEALIASYAALASQPRIVLATPCPVFKTGAFDIKPAVVRLEIAPATRELVTRLGLEVIEFHDRLDGHGEWFPDNVHPNSRGTAVMAAIAWAAITHAPANPSSPALGLTSVAGNRVAVRWPADAAGLVLQSATSLAATPPPWLVVEQLAVNDGAQVSVTNTLPGSGARFYRLWRP